MSVLAFCSVQSSLRRGLLAFLLSCLWWGVASPVRADDEFRLGNTILLGVGDHPAIIPIII